MDYGPFGFIERFEKTWNMWSGGGEHYSFRHQQYAGDANFRSFATSIALLLDSTGRDEIMNEILPFHRRETDRYMDEMFRRKLGLLKWTPNSKSLFDRLENLMEETGADYTMFWRQLIVFVESVLPPTFDTTMTVDYYRSTLPGKERILRPFQDVFYDALSSQSEEKWVSLLKELICLHFEELSGGHNRDIIVDSMRHENPKYVPREWMLISAYQAAAIGDYSLIHQLQELFEHPYDEMPEFESMYYKKTPSDLSGKGGVACMT